ncbi:MAG: glycerol-3-phosphate dehydrogenase, partial [Bacteroidota bacterium]
LSGGRFHSFKAFASEVGQTELTVAELIGLFHKYGENALQIISNVDWQNNDRTLAILLSELKYSIENEMITELSDFLIRRTGRLYFEKQLADQYANLLNEQLAVWLGLNDGQKTASLNTYLAESNEVLNFIQ